MKNNSKTKKAVPKAEAAKEEKIKSLDKVTTVAVEGLAEEDDDFEETTPAMIELIEKYLMQRYDFRFNKVTGRLEFKSKSAPDYQLLTDYLANSLLRELLKAKLNTSASALRGLLHSNFSLEYDPFAEYFKTLPPWDGKTDYIKALAATAKTNNDKLWQSCFKKWIVAMVGCVLKENIINHTVIVFSGKQGIGKTTWHLNLIPAALGVYCFTGNINPNNKDTVIHLSECMLINLDELESLNKSEIGSLKELITKPIIRVRRPYGYHSENLPRRASFAGSVNNSEFLYDTTGSRRFLCFEVSSIDYDSPVDLKNVYSQALYLFNNGFQYWFDQHEIIEIMANNEQYNVISVEEELLLTWYEPVEVSDAKLFLTTTEIATSLSEKTKFNITDAAKCKLGKALKKHDFKRIKRKNRYMYPVKQKDAETLGYQSKYIMVDDKSV